MRAATQANFTDLYTLLGTVNIPAWVPRTDTGQAAIWALDFRQGPSSGLFWYNGKTYVTFDLWRAAQSGTFTRSATGADAGWLDSASHLWLQSAADTLRAPHYAEDGTALGAVFDGSAQSIVLQARNLTNASWTKNAGCTVTRSAGIDGVANSCSRLTFTADGGYVTQALSTSAAARQPAFFIKRVSGSGPINLSSDAGVTPTDFSGQLTTSFHKRCALPTTSSATPEIRISGNAGDVIDIGGVGLAGPLLTTPIMAGSVAVSRNLDALALPASMTEGTLIVEGRTAPGLTANNAIFASLDNGTIGTSAAIIRGTSGKLQCTAVIGNVSQGLNDFGAYSDSTDFKIAYAIKAGAFKGSLNGASFVDSVTQLSLPTVTGFRAGITSFGAFGSIKTMALLPKAVSDGFLPVLSQNTANPLNVAGDSYGSGASGFSFSVSLFAVNARPINILARGGAKIDEILAQIQNAPAQVKARTTFVFDGSFNNYLDYDGTTKGYTDFYPLIAAAIGHNRFIFLPPGKRSNMSGQEIIDAESIRQWILAHFPSNSLDWQPYVGDPISAGNIQADGTHMNGTGYGLIAPPSDAMLVANGW